MNTVLLFDIDGTLLSSGRAGRRAMERAFAELHGSDEACKGFSFAGMTDRAIARAALRRAEIDDAEHAIDRVIERYLGCLELELPGATDYRVLPGVHAVLAEVRGRPKVAVGLGTGNVERGAGLKLQHAHLHQHFAFGGYGSDHESRPELIRIGAERGAAHLGVPRSDCRVVVIGDTPLDVGAALAIGAECVGVGTGRHSPDELRAAGATSAFATLDSDAARRAVLG
jgi:phosphoglycolate phosphatase